MAAVTAADVVINESWTLGNTNGRKFKCKDVTITFSSNGNTAGDVPASLFGMRKVFEVNSARKSDDTVFHMFPLTNQSGLITASATTGSFRMNVIGKE